MKYQNILKVQEELHTALDSVLEADSRSVLPCDSLRSIINQLRDKISTVESLLETEE